MSRPDHEIPWLRNPAYDRIRRQLKSCHSESLIHYTTGSRLWQFRSGVTYLNHGSFGAVPIALRRIQQQMRRAVEEEPMDLLARHTEGTWDEARSALAGWLGTRPDCIAFSENATVAMNETASSITLKPGDEVILNDHEYGAVKRIWQRRCSESGAVYREIKLPVPFTDRQALTDTLLGACNDKTRLMVLSHITSVSAVIMPVRAVCKELRRRGILSCIDGPHALLQERFSLDELDCDYYAASCHKWLCAPIGSGFLYVNPRHHAAVRPLRLSWGRLPPAYPNDWTEELTWVGTRDYSPYLTVPHAIRFFEGLDRDALDARNHELARYARAQLAALPGAEAMTPDTRDSYGWMAAVMLAPGDYTDLQDRLWKNYGIEVPIMRLGDRRIVRVSCHLYNHAREIDKLVEALRTELKFVSA